VANDEPVAATVARQPFTIPFEIPTYRTPEQVLAVVELLDELRTLIWARYDIRLVELFGAERIGQQIDINPSTGPDKADL
jgi:hypothetical protein